MPPPSLSELLNSTAPRKDISVWVIAVATLLLLVLWLAPVPHFSFGLNNYAPIHTILEIFSIAIATVIVAIGWHTRLESGRGNMSLVAAGFFAVVLFDTAHLLSYQGMPDWIVPANTDNAIYFWFAARFAAGITLLWLAIRDGATNLPAITHGKAMAISISYIIAIFWLLIGYNETLPPFFIEGQGLTTAKIALEWGLVAIILLTLLFVVRQQHRPNDCGSCNMLIALWLTILSELSFTLYADTGDLFNLLGHLYKVIGYLFLYQAIVVASIKRPYELLAESQQIMQQLTDNIKQVFWMTSPDKQQMLYVSPAYETIWKRSCESLLNTPTSWMDAIHPDDRQQVIAAATTQDRAPYNVEYRIVRPDGSIRWISDRAFQIMDKAGNTQRIVGVAEDVTDSHQTKEIMAASEARLRAMFKTASDGIHIINSSGTLIAASDSFLRSIGQDETAIGQLKAWEWDTLLPRKLIEENITRLLTSSETALVETRFRHRDGHELWVEISSRSFQIAGENLIYASSRDISERKQAEIEHDKLQTQLLQAQKMESIGHLAGGIAHDFNNILAAMLGYAELLKHMANRGPASSERLLKYSDAILSAGQRAKELVSQMLVFSRQTPTALSQTPVIKIEPIINEVLALLHASIPRTIEVTRSGNDDDRLVRIQPIHLHQIILNLAINARDAIGEYGTINICTERHILSHTLCNACHTPFSGDFVVIAVSDTGPGIPAPILTRIFDPFFTTKGVGKGSGMGLAVVHGLVHSLGGHIIITTPPEGGTTIQILLPAIPQLLESHHTSVAEPQVDSAPLAGLRIMVVDDELPIVTMIQELLVLNGAEVTAYNLSSQALAAFNAAPDTIDLVISDETMPELSGLDMARAMLRLRPALQILICTGYSDHISAEIATQNGIAGFMHKPIDIQQLLTWIMTHSRAPSPA